MDVNAVTLKGQAFPPHRALAVAAELRVYSDTAEIVGPEGQSLVRARRDALVIEPRLGRAPRRIVLPDGTLFVTEDHDGMVRLGGRDGSAAIHALERFHPRLVLVIAAIVGAVWLIWRHGLDVMAAAALALTPAPMVDAIDAGTLQTLDRLFGGPSLAAEADRAQATAVFDDLVAALDPEVRAGHDFRLEFRSMPRLGPNALALPGGTVVMTDAFLATFPSDDVRAGVLGHEIGHVVEQHGLRQLYKSLGGAVLVALLAGDTVPIVEDIVLEGNVLLSLSFSRASERAADDFGLRLAAAAGYEPSGLAQFFDWALATYGDGAGWFSTHPGSAERRERLRRLADEL